MNKKENNTNQMKTCIMFVFIALVIPCCTISVMHHRDLFRLHLIAAISVSGFDI